MNNPDRPAGRDLPLGAPDHLHGMTVEEYLCLYDRLRRKGCKIPPEVMQGLCQKGYMAQSGRGDNRRWRITPKVWQAFMQMPRMCPPNSYDIEPIP